MTAPAQGELNVGTLLLAFPLRNLFGLFERRSRGPPYKAKCMVYMCADRRMISEQRSRIDGHRSADGENIVGYQRLETS